MYSHKQQAASNKQNTTEASALPFLGQRYYIGLLLLLPLTVAAWGQSAPYLVPAASVEDQFAVYQQALSGAADEILGTTAGCGLVALVPLSAGPAVVGPSTAARDRVQSRIAIADCGRVDAPPIAGPAESGTSATTSVANVHIPDNPRLRQFARQYWGGQEQSVRRAVERLAQLRPVIDPILRAEGVPVDLAAVVLIESGGRTTALSPKGALGLWQLMPHTARRYGLVVAPNRDERLDAVKSTRAAARYLHGLYAQFSDWSLVLAAYNAGEETVQRAIAQSGVRHFDMLGRGSRLPLETRNYVPAALDAMRLIGGSLLGEMPSAQRAAKVMYALSD